MTIEDGARLPPRPRLSWPLTVAALTLIGVSLWMSVEVIVQIPQLQEGVEVRGSALSQEAMRKELETIKTNLGLPEGDTSAFSRSHPMQPVVNLLTSHGVSLGTRTEADVPSWLFGYANPASASPAKVTQQVRESLRQAGDLIELPLNARADLYRTLTQLRRGAEFLKTSLLERAAQQYRSQGRNSGSADDAREFFNAVIDWYYGQASTVNHRYGECLGEIAAYDSKMADTALQWSDGLAKSIFSGEVVGAPSLSLPRDLVFGCSVGALQPKADPVPTLGSVKVAGGLLPRLLGNGFKRLDVVLIIGMLALGLLGASASQLIRAEPGVRTATVFSKDTAGVVVRGITATLVVYLGVSCGLIVFASGDTKANPYALLLACFVASVFSEVVWAWARELVTDRLSMQANAAAAEATKRRANPASGKPDTDKE